MPDFTRAEVVTETIDLTPYRTFLKRLEVGQVVTLPLDAGERSRVVVRLLNLAAGHNGMRIARLPSGNDVIRFRVVSPARRAIKISEERKRARVEKARATRARRRTEPTPAVAAASSDVAPADEPAGMGSASSVPGESFALASSDAEMASQDSVPPEQQVQEAEVTEEAVPVRPARRRASKVAQNA